MCGLFALSARRPTSASFSLEAFAAQGRPGAADVDGWGLAYAEGRDVRLYKEPEPAGASAWLAYVLARSVDSRAEISHVRHASRGALTHANTQPFVRELAGRTHVFAHNGDLGDPSRAPLAGDGRFQPVGETDSEAAFCRLLERVAPLWGDGAGAPPALEARLEAVSQFAARMRSLGEANFLYADGDVIFGHSHRRVGSGAGGAPGLWRLERGAPVAADRMARSGVRIGPHGSGQSLAILASVPLTDEPWTPLAEGEIVILTDGAAQTSVSTSWRDPGSAP